MRLVEDSRVVAALEEARVIADRPMLDVVTLGEVELPNVSQVLTYIRNKRRRRQTELLRLLLENMMPLVVGLVARLERGLLE